MSGDGTERQRGFGLFGKVARMAVAMVLVLGLAAGSALSACDSAPVEAVATVNGEEIAMEEFDQVMEQQKMQYMMQGIDLESDEMADALRELEQQVLHSYFIYPTLLRQRAEEVGTVVSENEMEERYEEYAADFGGEDQLKEQLEAAGMSREDLDEQILRELSIGKYVDAYLEGYLEEHPEERIDEDMEIGGDEVEERYQQLLGHYNELKGMLEADDPEVPVEQVEAQYEQLREQYGDLLEEGDFEGIKPQLEEEMRQERVTQERQDKENRVIMGHIEELQEESDIEIYL